MAPASYVRWCGKEEAFDFVITYEALAERFSAEPGTRECFDRKGIQQAIRKAQEKFDPEISLRTGPSGLRRVGRAMEKIMDRLPAAGGTHVSTICDMTDLAYEEAFRQLKEDGLIFHFDKRYVQKGESSVVMRVTPAEVRRKTMVDHLNEGGISRALDSALTCALSQIQAGLPASPSWCALAQSHGLVTDEGALTESGSDLSETYHGILDRYGMRLHLEDLKEWSETIA